MMKAAGLGVMTQRDRRIAVGLAWLGVIKPLSGLHKFYLGQPIWGVIYLALSFTQIPRIACAIEGLMLLIRSPEDFAIRWGTAPIASESAAPADISALGEALRELDALRQEGLISELEFEQKRRQVLGEGA